MSRAEDSGEAAWAEPFPSKISPALGFHPGFSLPAVRVKNFTTALFIAFRGKHTCPKWGGGGPAAMNGGETG